MNQAEKAPAALPGAPDVKAVARSAGRRYVTDTSAGITRHAEADRFSYRDPHGQLLTAICRQPGATQKTASNIGAEVRQPGMQPDQ